MIKFFIIFSFCLPAVFAQELELENIDDLEILKEFEADEKELTQKNSTLNEPATDELELLNQQITSTQTEEDMTENSEEITFFDDIELNEQEVKLKLESKEDIEKKDREILDEFSKERNERVSRILKKVRENKNKRFKSYEIEALKVQLSDIVKSPIRAVHVPKGTKLINIETDEVFYITRPISTMAHTKLDFNKYRYIINKNNEVVYKTPYYQLADITNIADLTRKPHYFKRLSTEKKEVSLRDKSFPYSLQLNLHGGLSAPSYTQDLLNASSISAVLSRLEFIFMSNKKHFFNAGLSAHLETSTAKVTEDLNYQANNAALGAIFKFHNFWGQLDLIFQPKLSLFSQLAVNDATGTDILRLSETNLSLSIENATDFKNMGEMVYGLSFQRKWINTSTQGGDYNLSDRASTDNSLTLYIGHRSDWIW